MLRLCPYILIVRGNNKWGESGFHNIFITKFCAIDDA